MIKSEINTRTTSEIGIIKILILGDSGAGKTSLMLRYSNNKFEKNYINTLGVEFKSKVVTIDGENILVQIWDTAGQQQFHNITRTYYRRASAIILAYDSTSVTSFNGIKTWVKVISAETDTKIPMVLVATKCDSNKVISLSMGNELADELKLKIFETSSALDMNVKEVFEYLIARVMKKSMVRYSQEGLSLSGLHSNAASSNFKEKKKCC